MNETEGELILELVNFVIQELPIRLPSIPVEVVPAIEQLFAEFQGKHPTLGAAPPMPEKATIDAIVDAEIAKLST